jgi:hypothetical protein
MITMSEKYTIRRMYLLCWQAVMVDADTDVVLWGEPVRWRKTRALLDLYELFVEVHGLAPEGNILQ